MKTLNDLSHYNEISQQQALFLKQNNVDLFKNIKATDYDYRIFMQCSDVFQRTNVNYFERYQALIESLPTMHLEHGLKGFAQQHPKQSPDWWLEHYQKGIQQRIADMRFFGIKEVYQLDILAYQQLMQSAEESLSLYLEELALTNETQRLLQEKQRHQQYFNYSRWSQTAFKSWCEQAEESLQQTYSLTELESLTHSRNVNDIYLVVIYENHQAIEIGQTSQLMEWIANHSTNPQYQRFALLSIEPKYATEVMMNFLLNHPSISEQMGWVANQNRMYATLNQAKRIYESKGLSLGILKQIVQESQQPLWKIGKLSIIEKPTLDRYVKRYLKQIETKEAFAN